MSNQRNNFLTRVINKIFPHSPDFYSLILEQCVLLSSMGEQFELLMEKNDPDHAARIVELEHEADVVKNRNIMELNASFSTPIDREYILRAFQSIDMVMNYAKTTVREMEMLGIGPDDYTLEMVRFIREGIEAIYRGYGKLRDTPAEAEEDVQLVSKAERNVEKCYRRAVASILEPQSIVARLKEEGEDPELAWAIVLSQTLKRRELYRHLSNAADQLAEAGSVLHDILVLTP